jgi:hypothetical protein
MPIRPENKDRYPKNWGEIRKSILKRAKDRCEFCFADNYKPHPITGSKVVLTIAHMDHAPENNNTHNLKALCQKCHNGYDAKTRAQGIKERRHKNQIKMFSLVLLFIMLSACSRTQADPVRHDFTQELEKTRYLNAILEKELKDANSYIMHLEEEADKCHREEIT